MQRMNKDKEDQSIYEQASYQEELDLMKSESEHFKALNLALDEQLSLVKNKYATKQKIVAGALHSLVSHEASGKKQQTDDWLSK